MTEKRDKDTGCLKGYGEHQYCVVNTHRNNIKSCINCGDDKPIPTEREELTELEGARDVINKHFLRYGGAFYNVNALAQAILEWHKNKLQVGKTQNKYSDYNGGSVTPNKGRMK